MSKKRKVKKQEGIPSSIKFKKYIEELDELFETGQKLYSGLMYDINYLDDPKEKKKLAKMKRLSFKVHYEKWYSEALEVVRQILPNRLDDFKNLYKLEKRKEVDYLTYTISDYMIGLVTKFGFKVVADAKAAVPKFLQQVLILQSAYRRFESSLFDIKQLVQADIFDSEIDAARELHKKGFLRGAGAVAGVILEKHLGQVCDNHNILVRKKNPKISDYNDLLKKNDVIETPTWRFIQRLADLRNLCDHNKKKEPTQEEVIELIDGVEKITKTLI